jgi:hypothetical protein
MTTSTVDLAAFSGWVRVPGGRWRRVVGAPTANLAWSALHALKAGGQHRDLMVLPAGQDPRQRGRR